jgi:hypothetical protein
MRGALRFARVVVPMAIALAGCVVEGTLEPNGSARLRLTYRLVSVAHFERARASLQSADVTVTDASMTPEKRATFDLAVADVRKLSTAAAFARTAVTLADSPGGGERTLTITVEGNPTARLPPPYVTYLGGEFRLALTLPGDVVRSDATRVEGRTVTWVHPIVADGWPARSFTVTYRAAG